MSGADPAVTGDAARGHTGRDLLILAGLVLLTALPGLFTRDLWNPDEPRYTEVAREMAVRGDYLVPQLNGEPYTEKPPLFFWMAAGFWKLGAGQASGRLVTLLAVFGILALVYFGVRPSLGSKGGLLAAVVALSAFLLCYLSRRGVIDPLLAFFTTGAALAGYHAMQPTTARRRLYWLACYAAVGLGALEKGPPALMVPGLVLLVYGLFERRRVKGGGWVHLAGVGLFLLIALPWVVAACAAGGPEYTDALVVKHLTGQAVDSFSHPRPFYYYLYNGPAALWPWILVLPLGVIAALRRRWRQQTPLAFFATVWMVVPFLMFSAISIKRMNYLLPIVPAAGILVAWYLTVEGVREPGLLKADRVLTGIALWVALALGVVMAAAAVAAGPVLGNARVAAGTELSPADLAWLRGYFSPWRAVLAVVLTLPALVAAVLGLRTPAEWGRRRAAMLAAAMLLLWLPVQLVGNQAVNVFKSGRRFGAVIRQHAPEATDVYLYDSKGFSGVYNLYSGLVHMPQVTDEAQLRTILSTPGTLVVAEAKQVSKVLSEEEVSRRLVYEEGVGHRQMVLLRGIAEEEPAPDESGLNARTSVPRSLPGRAGAVGTGEPHVRAGGRAI